MAESYINILLATIFVFIGFDLMRPAVTSYLSKVAGNEQGFVSGMNSMFTSFGNMFGPIVGGALFDINLDYPFYFAAFALIIGIILTFLDRKSTRLNSSHVAISYAVFCLKTKKKTHPA